MGGPRRSGPLRLVSRYGGRAVASISSATGPQLATLRVEEARGSWLCPPPAVTVLRRGSAC